MKSEINKTQLYVCEIPHRGDPNAYACDAGALIDHALGDSGILNRLSDINQMIADGVLESDDGYEASEIIAARNEITKCETENADGDYVVVADNQGLHDDVYDLNKIDSVISLCYELMDDFSCVRIATRKGAREALNELQSSEYIHVSRGASAYKQLLESEFVYTDDVVKWLESEYVELDERGLSEAEQIVAKLREDLSGKTEYADKLLCVRRALEAYSIFEPEWDDEKVELIVNSI